MEVPECPVCLQVYDEEATIPRVLSCGHSACEPCIAQIAAASLPSSLPDTIRCPGCTRVVRYNHALGPTSLPKNIDLLRFCSSRPSSSASYPIQPSPSEPMRPPPSFDHFPLPWTDELFSTWRDWILPADAISIETITTATSTETTTIATTSSSSCNGNSFFRQNQLVSLLHLGASSHLSSLSTESKWFKFSYTARVLKAINLLSKRERDELGIIMAASRQQRHLSRVYGLWMNSTGEKSSLCLVSERFCSDLLGVLKERENCDFREIADERFSRGLIGMELCEAVMGLHLQGVASGNLGPSCFCFDDCGHCLLDLHNVLLVGRSLRKEILDARRSDQGSKPAKTQTFVSPELLTLLDNKVVASNLCSLEVGYGSDVWSLACLLVMLLVGDASLNTEVLGGCCDKNSCEPCLDQYEPWMKNLLFTLEASLLGSPFESLTQMIVSCFNHDPSRRPHASDVWKSIRDLCIKPRCDILAGFDVQFGKEKFVCCLVLGDLCSLPKEAGNDPQKLGIDVLQGSDNFQEDFSVAGLLGNSGQDDDNFQQGLVDGDLVKGLQVGGLKSVTLQGHRDCITGLAVGGGFLFSSSYDKTVHVWSLKDFSHVQSLSGHEHRVMALLVLEVNQLMCITGDSGGCICIWGIGTSVKQEPLKKWYEHTDWRYSGVHSLAFSGSQYLYSGSGDKSIKAWSLKDFSLACTMTGHKSVVSSLLVADGILYSGSWDGTIRLWLLDDHSPLTVFGDEGSSNGTSVLSLWAGCHLLVASYANGCLKMWRNDVLARSMQIQNGAIFALHACGKWLFSGGWDKVVDIQELSEIEFQVDVRPVGSIDCDSVITSLFYWEGKLFVGLSNKEIKRDKGFRGCTHRVRGNPTSAGSFPFGVSLAVLRFVLVIISSSSR